MRRVIEGKIYNTETAVWLADNTYADGRNRFAGGRATFLYRTKKGAYFANHLSCWQGEHDSIEPLTTDRAVALYEQLCDDSAVPFEDAFPGIAVEEA